MTPPTKTSPRKAALKAGAWKPANRKPLKRTRLYMETKNWMLDVVSRRPWCLEETDAVRWCVGFFPLIKMAVEEEQYEVAQAFKDAMIEFLNGLGAEIPKGFLFNLDLTPDDYTKAIETSKK